MSTPRSTGRDTGESSAPREPLEPAEVAAPDRSPQPVHAVQPDPRLWAPAANTTRPLHAARPALPTLPKHEEVSGFGGVLGRRDFRLLWLAQALSQLADKFLMGALLVIVYEHSGNALAESALMICYTLPSVLLSAPAGVYADRHDKRMLMVSCNALRGALVLLIPATQLVPALSDASWPLLVVTLLFSSVGQVFAPAEAASIPLLVSRRDLTVANSLFMTTVIVTLVVGVPLAGLSLRLLGDQPPFYVAAMLLMLAALSVGAVRTRLHSPAATQDQARGMIAELTEGIGILAHTAVLRVALAELTISLVTVFTVFTLGAPYLHAVLHRPESDTYIVLVPATIGMMTAAVLLGRFAARISRARLLVAALVVTGAVLALLGVSPSLLAHLHAEGLQVTLVVLLAVVFGCALGSLLIPAFTVLQENTTEDSRGRIFGGIFTVINAAVAVPLLLAGAVAQVFGTDWVLGGLGAMLVLGGVLAATSLRPRLAVLDAPPLQPVG